MFLQHTTLAVLWIIYCVLHSVLASLPVKLWVRQLAKKHYRHYRLFYTLFAAVTLAAIVLYQFSLSSPWIYRQTTLTNVLGGLLFLAGLSIMAICIRKYFVSLSGVKSLLEETPASELMITGIHRRVRHPLYSGTFLAIWGLWVLFPSLGLLITDTIITVYTLLAIRLEEQKLLIEFGDQYKKYQQTVPKLIPRFS